MILELLNGHRCNRTHRTMFLRRRAFRTSRPCGSAAHRRDDHNVWEGCALPNSPTGWGSGETRFPLPLREGQALPRAGVWGNLVPLCSRETVMRIAHHARCNRPGSAGGTPAPRLRGHGALPDPPPLGAVTRLLPPAGEAGRGAERCARWSPQPDRGNRRARKDGCAARLARSRPGPGGCGHRQARVARVAACERVSMGPPDSTTRR